MSDSLFTPECIAAAHAETERLCRDLDITNADHIALWLEANIGDASLGYLAVRIIEAHETALRASTDAAAEPVAYRYVHLDYAGRKISRYGPHPERVNGHDPIEAHPLYDHPPADAAAVAGESGDLAEVKSELEWLVSLAKDSVETAHAVKEIDASAAKVIAALSVPPATDTAQAEPVGLREAVEGIADDYMTSETHHPGYVLIPTAKFEQIVVAAERAKEIVPEYYVNWHHDAGSALAVLSTPPAEPVGLREDQIEVAALAFAKEFYGPGFDPFQNPEAYDMAKKATRAALGVVTLNGEDEVGLATKFGPILKAAFPNEHSRTRFDAAHALAAAALPTPPARTDEMRQLIDAAKAILADIADHPNARRHLSGTKIMALGDAIAALSANSARTDEGEG